jgi:deaminated glutathione amidase
MTDTLRVAGIQMVSAATVAPNLEAASRLIAQAAAQGAQLVALPEFFPLLGRRDTDKVDVREPAGDGPIQACLADAARRHRVWLVGGTLPLVAPEPRRVMNSCLVYAPTGELAARYDKVHLFGLSRGTERFDESATIAPGRTPVVFDLHVDGGARAFRIGLSVCYDLRFPEYYRALGACDLLLVPSAFTYPTGQAHWEVLLRARAIENQCYVLAPAQGGRHENGRRTWGHTLLVDPWGDVQGCLPEGEGIVAGEVDPDRLAEVRSSLPALSHRTM